MRFVDTDHAVFFKTCIERANAQDDPYRKALFYTLGLTGETRRNIRTLYNFHEKGISFDGLSAPWQTGTSIVVTRMAFNLYNGFAGDTGGDIQDDPVLYSPYHLFDTGLTPFFIEAIKLRYPSRFRTESK